MTVLLLDTHVVLWMVSEPHRLGSRATAEIANLENDVLVSVASVWEVAIKSALGRLSAPENLWDEVEASGVTIITIERDDAVTAGALPPHHRDPFDRMLVAQAGLRRAQLVTADATLRLYDVPVLHAAR